MKTPLVKLLLLFIMMSCTVKAELFIYKLKFVKASQVIPVIKPHLSPSAELTGERNRLFADVSAEENKKIITMLEMLDKNLNEYLVEVKILNRRLDKWEMKSATVNSGEMSARTSVKRYSTAGREGKNFQIRLTEGNQGFVNTGESFPTHQIVHQYKSFLPKTGYRKITSGIYVLVKASENNQVTLNISAQAQQKNSASTSITSSSTASTVTAHKNEWFLLATTGENQQTSGSKKYTTSSGDPGKRWYYARVKDLVN